MTNQQIIEKAIKKAVAAGWDGDEYGIIKASAWLEINDGSDIVDTDAVNSMDGRSYDLSLRSILFSHDFAQALWPKDGFAPVTSKAVLGTINHSGRVATTMRPGRPTKGSWQYHLQNMVVSEDPIAYLGESL